MLKHELNEKQFHIDDKITNTACKFYVRHQCKFESIKC